MSGLGAGLALPIFAWAGVLRRKPPSSTITGSMLRSARRGKPRSSRSHSGIVFTIGWRRHLITLARRHPPSEPNLAQQLIQKFPARPTNGRPVSSFAPGARR